MIETHYDEDGKLVHDLDFTICSGCNKGIRQVEAITLWATAFESAGVVFVAGAVCSPACAAKMVAKFFPSYGNE